MIRESQLFPYFEETCLSYELGMKKPDPEIFLKCMEGLGVRAGECLYIGDGGSHELEAADIMGMTALQARWYIKEVPELDIRKEKFEQLETPDGGVRKDIKNDSFIFRQIIYLKIIQKYLHEKHRIDTINVRCCQHWCVWRFIFTGSL